MNPSGLDDEWLHGQVDMEHDILDRPANLRLLDIDNFKRPNDTVVRIGGEEFIILYPESDLNQASAVLVRLQRALTRTFFLADESKILITFSAGASAWLPGESMDAVIERADAAMYEAKQTGKNKVVVG
ncbi:GGDEF domain-containing protein [Rhodocyclaceae bacterium SMB388]